MTSPNTYIHAYTKTGVVNTVTYISNSTNAYICNLLDEIAAQFQRLNPVFGPSNTLGLLKCCTSKPEIKDGDLSLYFEINAFDI